MPGSCATVKSSSSNAASKPFGNALPIGMSRRNYKPDTSKTDEFRSLESSSIQMILPALVVAGFFDGQQNKKSLGRFLKMDVT